MSKKDWQVGPVLKDKLDSQGTLFRGGTKYSSDKRYPKGYTPERQAEVADAVVRPSVQNYLNKPAETSTGTQSKHFKDRRVTVGLNPDYPKGYRMESAQPTRNLVDNVARSTVPVEHLRGVQFRTSASEAMLGEKVAGHYDKRGDAMTNGDPVIRLKEGADSTSTAIHEIGHHVSQAHEGNIHPYDEHGFSGPEEAWADNYAEEHFRDPKGKQEQRYTYGGGPWGGHIQRSDEFWSSYGKNRSWGLNRASTAAQNEEYYQKYPEEKVHPDNTMDEPLIHKSYVNPDDYKAGHDKPELAINPEAEHWSSKYAW